MDSVSRYRPMVGFTREQLEGFRGAGVPDLIGEGCRLLFVGINPGLWTAATQTHFCHPSNRFYPALRAAGLIDWSVDADRGMTDEQRGLLTSRGIGITNLVNRATVRASELGREELRDGAERLRELVDELEPAVVAVAGITAYRDAFGARGAQQGRQPEGIGPAEVWVVPNPSGLNAHETVDTLANRYHEAAEAAGIA
jgi:TDG/mug DNA glycosylase family protein